MANRDILSILYYGQNIPREKLKLKSFYHMSLQAQMLYCRAWSDAVDLLCQANKARKRGKLTQEDCEAICGCFVYTPEYMNEYLNADISDMKSIYNELSQNGFFLKNRDFDKNKLAHLGDIDYNGNSNMVIVVGFRETHIPQDSMPKPTRAGSPTRKRGNKATQEQQAEPVKQTQASDNDPFKDAESESQAPPPHIQEHFNTMLAKAGQAPIRFDHNGSIAKEEKITTPSMQHIYNLKAGNIIDDYVVKCLDTHPAKLDTWQGTQQAQELYQDILNNKGNALTEEQCKRLHEITDEYKDYRQSKPKITL